MRTLIRLDAFPNHVRVFGDNNGVVEGWWRLRSRNPPTNVVFRRIFAALSDAEGVVHTRYVASANNPADDPSRGIYDSPSRLLPPVELGEELSCFLVNWDSSEDTGGGDAIPKSISDKDRLERMQLNAQAERDSDEFVSSYLEWDL